MSGYYIKQTIFILIGVFVGIWLCNNPDKWADGPIGPPRFSDYLVFCGVLGCIGWFLAWITGKPDNNKK